MILFQERKEQIAKATLRQRRWNAGDFVAGMNPQDLALDSTELEKHRDYFWFDLCAEWDSRHLHEYLQQSSLVLSPEFRRFEELWFEDEINHAEGFMALYSFLYGQSTSSIRRELRLRKPDFDPIASHLDSEFKLTLLMAYDELATMRAYHLDLELYGQLGPPKALTFLRALIRDETYHHENAMAVLTALHHDRVDEIPAAIECILERDLTSRDYRATFVFDHEWDHIDDAFFKRTATILNAKIASQLAAPNSSIH